MSRIKQRYVLMKNALREKAKAFRFMLFLGD